MHKILVIRLYFSIYAVHVSDCIIPSSEAIFFKLYVVGSKSFRPDIPKPRQMENAVRDI